jgi:hypothetical protein
VLVERLINAATMHRKHPCEVYDMVALANEAAATICAQAEENERLKADNHALETRMEDCVAEKLSEINAEAEAFDKECWNALRSVCESRPGFDWRDFDDCMTADDAAQYLYECFRDADRANAQCDALKDRAEAAEAELARIKSAEGCDVEGAARVLCKSGKFETGQGTCALTCMDQLGDARKRPCSHVVEVHGDLVSAALAVGCAPLRAKIEEMEAVVKAACEYEAYPSEQALDELETRVIEYTRREQEKE